MALRAVVWDYDDTLVPVHTFERWQWAWKPQGPVLNERHVRASIREGMRRWDRRRWQGLVGDLPPADLEAYHDALREMLYAIAGRSLPTAETEAVLARFPRFPGPIEPFADVGPCLDVLRGHGLQMGVMVGPMNFRPREILGELRLLDRLPRLFGEGSTDPHAPAAAAFEAACSMLEVAPSETAFVGDLFWSDVRAASRAGLKGVLLDRHDWWSRVESVRIRSLSELSDRLASLEASPSGTGTGYAPPPSDDVDPL